MGGVKGAIKFTFGLIAAALFAYPSYLVLRGALETPGFEPNDAQTFLLDTFGAAIVAFIAAQLGISIVKDGTFGKRLKASMGDSAWGVAILIVDVVLLIVVGAVFVVLWVNPSLLAVAEGGEPLAEAPEFISAQAQLFIGLVVAAAAAVGTSA